MTEQSIINLSNFIGNEYIPPLHSNYLNSPNPANGEAHLNIPDSSAEDVEKAVQAAEAAFPQWSETKRESRAAILNRIADIIDRRAEEFAQAESSDQGKPVWYARVVDIARSAYNFRFFAGQILYTHEQLNKIDGVATNYSLRQPIGVAGLISPWNLPLYLLTWKIAPCIAFGNTCVCKPSEFTSLTAYLLCSVLKEAGLPAGVVNMIFGIGPNAGQALVEHPRVPLISFTGGTATGRKINETCAPMFKKVSLEMGGKNANIIFDDCDLEKAVETSIRSSFWNQGEICLCGSRIYVQRAIYQRFLDAFVPRARALVVGDPSRAETHLGPLVSESHMHKVLGYVRMAEEEGGVIQCGGRRMETRDFGADEKAGIWGKGYFVMPTVITDLSPTSRVMREEIFGPVVTIHPFDTEDEAIELANDSPYGLACCVWTESGRRGRRCAERIKAGYVWVNCWMVRDLTMPFGGVKQSGLGREGGEFSREFFTDAKTICLAD